MRNLIIAIVIVVLIALGAFILMQSNGSDSPANETSSDTQTQQDDTGTNDTSTPTEDNTPDTNASETVTITYTNNGFSPTTATVRSGGSIVWVNNSGSQLQIGVDPHPSHTGNKEITDGEFVTTIEAGGQQTVQVDRAGTYGYHNHLNSGDTGTVVVQ